MTGNGRGKKSTNSVGLFWEPLERGGVGGGKSTNSAGTNGGGGWGVGGNQQIQQAFSGNH